MSRRWWVIAMTLAGVMPNLPALGQRLMEADRVVAAEQAFQEGAAAPKLRCQVEAVPPQLNFAFRFRAGYALEIPLNQFPEGTHEAAVFIRVTPQGRQPVYLGMTETIPASASTTGVRLEARAGGSFVVGEGAYRVEVLVQDDLKRECRGAWNIQTRRAGSERQLQVSVAPGGVEEAHSSKQQLSEAGPAAPKMGRLTILLHAAPVAPNVTGLQPSDIDRLTQSLFSVLTELAARRVRVIAFNLDQGNVVFQKDGFAARQLTDVRSALEQLQLAKVNYEVLQRPEKPIELLLRLVSAELAGGEPPDALIILGSRPRTPGEASGDSLSQFPASATPIFYLQCRMNAVLRREVDGGISSAPPIPRGRGARGMSGAPATLTLAGGTDAIEELLKRLKGQTLAVRTPHELADAIAKVEGALNRPQMDAAKGR